MLNMTSEQKMRQPLPAMRIRGRLVAEVADSVYAVREAQALRHDVFREEYGVIFDTHEGVDHDEFDAWCRHLLVREQETGRVIATTRLLSDYSAALAGGFYSGIEFDLKGLLGVLQGPVLEIGRTCVHPEFRSGAAITTLWSALADLLVTERYAYLMGCASISLQDGGAQYQAIMQRLRENHWTDSGYRVYPLNRVPATEINGADVSPMMPPLLRTYMRMGAVVCGEACWDPAFNCADVFVLLDVARLDARYASRFFGRTSFA